MTKLLYFTSYLNSFFGRNCLKTQADAENKELGEVDGDRVIWPEPENQIIKTGGCDEKCLFRLNGLIYIWFLVIFQSSIFFIRSSGFGLMDQLEVVET